MLFKEEKYYRLSEQFLAVDFGDEGKLVENIYSLSIADRLRKASIQGVIDILSMTCSLMVGFDSSKITAAVLVPELKRWTKELREKKGIIAVPSRIFSIPVFYGDKWTRECAAKYDVPANLELSAEYNKLSVDEFIKIHTSQTYWVKNVGFAPGLAGFISLSPDKELRAPKYEKPRTWTPSGTLALGGNGNCIYPFEVPGGYQMLGRTPLPVFDIECRNTVFKDGPAILTPGTRIKIIPINEREYEEISKNADNYEYQVEDGVFEFAVGGE